jgi:hypothetical protein
LFFFVEELDPQGSLYPNPLFFFVEEPAIPPFQEQVPLPLLLLIVPLLHKVFEFACGAEMKSDKSIPIATIRLLDFL